MILRKLTRKSIIGFGKFKDSTVQNILDLQHYNYLRWVYYCNSHINFFDDILIELSIIDDYIIPKPGTNEGLFEKLRDEKYNKMTSLGKLKYNAKANKNKRIKSSLNIKTVSKENSKQSLLNKNHGR